MKSLQHAIREKEDSHTATGKVFDRKMEIFENRIQSFKEEMEVKNSTINTLSSQVKTLEEKLLTVQNIEMEIKLLAHIPLLVVEVTFYIIFIFCCFYPMVAVYPYCTQQAIC